MENREILVSIAVPDDQVQKATKAIIEQREAVDELKATNAELAKTVGKSSQEYVKNEATIKRLNAEIQQNQRTLIAAEKATKANDGSIRSLREQLSAATAAYNNLSKEERENSQAGIQLQKQTRALSDELKKLEGQVGNNTRNVGNYSEGFKQAVTAQNGMAGSALKLFDTMKANPILFIVSLFVQLIQKVGAMQSVTDGLNKVLLPLNTVFERIVGILQQFASTLFDAFTSWENFKNAFSSFSFSDVADQLQEAWKEGEELAAILVKIDDAQLKLIENEGKLDKQFNQAVERSKNLLLTSEQRKAAADEAVKIAEQQFQLEADILLLQIRQAEIKVKQNDTDRKAAKELAQLRSTFEDLENKRDQRTREVRQQAIQIEKNELDKAAAARKKASEDAKRFAEQEKRQKEQAEKETERLNQERTRDAQAALKLRLDTAIKAAEEESQIAINALKAQFASGLIDKATYEAQLTEIQRAALATRLAISQEFQITEQERLMVGAEFAANIEAELTQKRLANEQAVLDEKINSIQKAADLQEKADKKAAEDAKKLADLKMSVANQVLSNTLEIVGRESAAGKAVASFQAALNAYQAFNAALATPLPPPIPQILAASNLALGLAQVAKINSTPPPKFADGVIGLDGPGNGTSDSINAKLSRGESVMTAKATTAFAPVLAEMERMVGNRPNYNYSRGKFATGVIGSRGMAANFANLGTEPSVNEALQNMTIVTRITDIDRVNRRREKTAMVTEID
jgi:hypothetical protein